MIRLTLVLVTAAALADVGVIAQPAPRRNAASAASRPVTRRPFARRTTRPTSRSGASLARWPSSQGCERSNPTRDEMQRPRFIRGQAEDTPNCGFGPRPPGGRMLSATPWGAIAAAVGKAICQTKGGLRSAEPRSGSAARCAGRCASNAQHESCRTYAKEEER